MILSFSNKVFGYSYKTMMLSVLFLFIALISGCNENDQSKKLNLTLVINTDRFADELSWNLVNSKHEVVRSGSGYESNTEYQIPIGIDPGGYRFEIKDSGTDGICCTYGSGSFKLYLEGDLIVDDSGSFGKFSDEIQHRFNTDNYSNKTYVSTLEPYYIAADLLDGYELKTALHEIISNAYVQRDFDDTWVFFAENSLDTMYDKDSTILDRYSEKPTAADSYTFNATDNQCGSFVDEGDCYDREYVVPKDWFRDRTPMNSDIHNLFPADGKIMSLREGIPHGEVDNRKLTYTSPNNSKIGQGHLELNYAQKVFEPIDQFKGDFARAYFYMATRYEDKIVSEEWYKRTEESTGVFVEESGDQVYQSWFIEMLLYWNELDPVSAEEINRNNAAQNFQGNRNPFIDHPKFAKYIWTHEGFDPAEYYVY